MQKKERNGLQWLEFDQLADIPHIRHGVFLRHGGTSQGDYTSLNMGLGIGDDDTAVQQNVSRALDTLDIATFRSLHQTHGINITEATFSTPETTDDCDALISSTPDLGLLIKHADCQATIIYDPVEHRVANIHSGWRGSVQNIYAAVVGRMKALGSKPENLLVCVGPSLCPQHAEFVNYRNELPEPFWDFQTQANHFDFWAISRKQLNDTGVLDKHIETAEISTHANPRDFFSYRRDGKTGRHGTVVMLKER